MESENPEWKTNYDNLKQQQDKLDKEIEEENDKLKHLSEERNSKKSKKEDYRELYSDERAKREEIIKLLDKLFPIQNILKQNGEKIDNLIGIRNDLQKRKDQKREELISGRKDRQNLMNQMKITEGELAVHSKEIDRLEVMCKYRKS